MMNLAAVALAVSLSIVPASGHHVPHVGYSHSRVTAHHSTTHHVALRTVHPHKATAHKTTHHSTSHKRSHKAK